MQITVNQIQQIVSTITNVSIEKIISETRKAEIVQVTLSPGDPTVPPYASFPPLPPPAPLRTTVNTQSSVTVILCMFKF